MRVLGVINHALCDAGVFGDEAIAGGHEFDEWQPSEGPLPRPLTDYDAVISFGGGMQADRGRAPPVAAHGAGCARGRPASARSRPSGCAWAARCWPVPPAARSVPPRRPRRGSTRCSSPTPARGTRCSPVCRGPCPSTNGTRTRSGSRRRRWRWPAARSCLQAFRVGDRAWGLQWHPEVIADTALMWAQIAIPAVDGVPVDLDPAQLAAAVAERMQQANQDGRELCRRFLRIAATRACALSGRELRYADARASSWDHHRRRNPRAAERDHRPPRRAGGPHHPDRGRGPAPGRLRAGPDRRHGGHPAGQRLGGAAVRRLSPAQRQRRADRAGVGARVRDADQPDRPDQHAQRRGGARRADRPRARRERGPDAGYYWSLPVVGETWDGMLNDINGFHVKPEHVHDGDRRRRRRARCPRAASAAAPG